MLLRKLINISVFLILPILLISLGNSMSSLTRVYVGSGVFGLSDFLGALVTISFYTQNIQKKIIKFTIIFFFGIVVPILYIISAMKFMV